MGTFVPLAAGALANLVLGVLRLAGGSGSGLVIKTRLLSCSAENSPKGSSLVIYDIMNEIVGKKFSPQDPDDGMSESLLSDW